VTRTDEADLALSVTSLATGADGLRLEPRWTGQARVAIAHDYLTQRGGAERVTLALLEAFPGAQLITSVYHPEGTYEAFGGCSIQTSWLQRLPLAQRDPRTALPFMPGAWNRLRADDVDVVIASSTGFAHGIQTRAKKIVYCHNPPRWLYQRGDYVMGQPSLVRAGLSVLTPYLRRHDMRAAASADRYIANSTSVARRIKAAYGVDAPVIFPPALMDASASQMRVEGVAPDYFLTVSRPRGYKNTAVACEAVQGRGNARLVVVGGLPPHPRGGVWGPAITGLRDVSDAQLRWLYANCRALIAPSYEDFGLTPVEAAMFGKPTVALRAGGYLDTVLEGVTGTFADSATTSSVAEAIQALERGRFNPAVLTTHGRLFGLERFVKQMQQQVADVLQ
jgi:glycosyltransferase involved in cell wall biosynthesis